MSRAARRFCLLGLLAVGAGGCRARVGESDSLSPNAGCYVCHMTFVGEPIARVHLEAKVYCTTCHGVSAGHANDENVGATPPDIVFERDRVNAHCRGCHEGHDAAPERVLAVWRERTHSLPPDVATALEPICTDCHGEHRIAPGP